MFDEKSLIINVEKSIKNTFLTIKNFKLNTQSYEFKILKEEEIDYLLKQQIEYEDNEEILKFNINNLISLDDYMKNNKLKKNDVKFIIRSIDNMLNSIENYLVSENSILIDVRTIMIEKEKNKVSLKFVAIANLGSDFSLELSKLLIRLLRNVDASDKDSLTLCYQLFVKSSKENFTINDLLMLCDKDDEKNNSNFDENYNDEYYETIDYGDEVSSTYNEDLGYEENELYENIEENADLKNDEKINDALSFSDEKEDTKTTEINNEIDNDIEIDNDVKDILNDHIFDKPTFFKKKKKNDLEKKEKKKIFSFKGDINMVLLKKFILIFFIFFFPVVLWVFLKNINIYQKIQIVVMYEVLAISILILNKVIDKVFSKIK